MSNRLLIRQKPLEFEAMRFPNGGMSQGKVMDWIKSHGGSASLYDGWYRTLDDPASDGSYYRWDFISVPVRGEPYRSRHAYYGDYIVHLGDGDFRVVKPWDLDLLFDEVRDA